MNDAIKIMYNDTGVTVEHKGRIVYSIHKYDARINEVLLIESITNAITDTVLEAGE